MPRLIDSRSWDLLREVPSDYFRLVKEVLSLRQKITLARQNIHFLRRCIKHQVVPPFIQCRRVLDKLRVRPEDSQRLFEMEMRLLRDALRRKQDTMYSFLRKCEAKESSCERLLDPDLWKRIMDGSVFICDSLRSDTKEMLRQKFEVIRNQSRANDPSRSYTVDPPRYGYSSTLRSSRSSTVLPPRYGYPPSLRSSRTFFDREPLEWNITRRAPYMHDEAYAN